MEPTGRGPITQEQIYRLLERAETVVLVLDDSREVVHATGALEGLLDRSEPDLVGSTLREVVHPADYDDVVNAMEEDESPEASATVTCRVDAGDQYRWLELTPDGDVDSDGDVLVGHDVTAYKQEQQQQAHLASVFEKLHEGTERLYDSTSMDACLDATIDAAVDILGFDWCVLARATDGAFEIEATSEGAPIAVGTRPLDTDEGAAGHAYQTGTATIVYENETSDVSNATDDRIESSLSVPVGSWGVFQALSTRPETFEEQDQRLAEALVSALETTIERLAMEQELRDRQRSLERENDRIEALHEVATEMKAQTRRQEIYELTVEAVEEVLDFEVCSLDVADEDVLVTKAVGSEMDIEDYYAETPIEDSDSLAAETYRTGRSFVVDDLHDAGYAPAQSRYQSAISVPLGEFGVFQIAAERAGAFDDIDRRLTELLTDHAVTAVNRIERERERKRRTEELERQNERLEEFAGVVSHDLRNPLNVASGKAELAVQTGDLDYVETVQSQLERMETIVEDVLTLAKQGRAVGSVEPIALGPFVRECWSRVETDEASLTVDGDYRIEADRDRLANLFENLIRNSVEHAGPAVHVEVGVLEDERGVYVADDGPGIPAERTTDVFEHGYSEVDDGTGFGLAIVRRIAQAHGWRVRAVPASEADGARFELTGITVERRE